MKALSLPKALRRYSHGVGLPAASRLVHTSGQLGVATDGSVPEGSRAQAAICFENVRHILADAGMGPSDVCHISAYVTDRAHMTGYMAARDAFLSDVSVLPSSNPVIVTGFTWPEFVVEVEV